MKTIGIGLIVLAILWVIFAMNLDVSVPVIGGSRVNNIGLISDRHNQVIIAGLIGICGVLLLIFGNDDGVRKSGYMPCPLCAEDIKSEAIICKYCHSPIAEAKDRMSKAAHLNETELKALINKITKQNGD